MPNQGDSSPATKADIGMLMESIGKYYSDIHGEMLDLKGDIRNLWIASDELKRYIDVKLEELAHDIIGAYKDDVSTVKNTVADHELRIQRTSEKPDALGDSFFLFRFAVSKKKVPFAREGGFSEFPQVLEAR